MSLLEIPKPMILPQVVMKMRTTTVITFVDVIFLVVLKLFCVTVDFVRKLLYLPPCASVF